MALLPQIRQHLEIPVREDCCPKFDYKLTTDEVDCAMPAVLDEFIQLMCKHKYAFVNRKRIMELAEPKQPIAIPHVPRCSCIFRNPIERFYPDQPQHTRTEQLAYPRVRKLLLFKDRVKNYFPVYRLAILNRLTRESLLSVYSRLANVWPPEKSVPIKKWTPAEWKTHTAYLKKLAKPKKEIEVKVPRIACCKPLESMKRFKKLAKPKKRYEESETEWKLTEELKTFKASERLQKIALPRNPRQKGQTEGTEMQPMNPAALKYKASDRIKALSTPMAKKAGQSDMKENPFGVSKNALKCKASKRLEELAEPKEYENTHIREDPTAISPAALKAKASPRTNELAEPRTRREKIEK